MPRWYWLCESWVLETLVVWFRWLSFLTLGVSNWLGDCAMRSAQILDPVGVEWRRQELAKWAALLQSDEDADSTETVDH